MSVASNARSHAESFHWWRGNPDMTLDESELRDLIALRDAADELIANHVRAMRGDDGLTWTNIGDILGISAQVARTRYAPRES